MRRAEVGQYWAVWDQCMSASFSAWRCVVVEKRCRWWNWMIEPSVEDPLENESGLDLGQTLFRSWCPAADYVDDVLLMTVRWENGKNGRIIQTDRPHLVELL